MMTNLVISEPLQAPSPPVQIARRSFLPGSQHPAMPETLTQPATETFPLVLRPKSEAACSPLSLEVWAEDVKFWMETALAGNFEDISLPEGTVDLVWSQDALLHSGDRGRVLGEVSRVLARGGHFVFTDIMQSDSCSPDAMQPILDRINLESLGSLEAYRKVAEQVRLEEVTWIDLSPNLSTHYTRVLEEVQANYDDLSRVCSEDYIKRAQIGLQHWIDSGQSGDLAWGFFISANPS